MSASTSLSEQKIKRLFSVHLITAGEGIIPRLYEKYGLEVQLQKGKRSLLDGAENMEI